MTTRNDGKASLTELGQSADLLTEQLRRADRLIREMGFAVFASVPLAPGEVLGGALVFGKRHNVWGMYILHEGRELDLMSASIQLRAQSALQVPALIDALGKAHKNKCADLQADGEKLRGYLDKLESLKGHLDVPAGPLAKKPEPPEGGPAT